LALHAHLAITKALGVLLESSQFGQGIITFQQLLQRFACRIGQGRFDQLFQAVAFGSECVPDNGL
jgi:hypothetical protein